MSIFRIHRCSNVNCGKLSKEEDGKWASSLIHKDGLVRVEFFLCEDCSKVDIEKSNGISIGGMIDTNKIHFFETSITPKSIKKKGKSKK